MRACVVVVVALLSSACASAPTASDTVDVPSPGSSSGQPLPGISVSDTFPQGLQYATRPPPNVAKAQNTSHATPATDADAKALASQLAREVLAKQLHVRALGPTVVMQVAEGDAIELVVDTSDKPFAAYAISSGGVTELDLHVAMDPSALLPADAPTVPGLDTMPLADDTETGPTASIGMGKTGLFINSVPVRIPTTVRATPRKGSGLVALQLFTGRP